MKSIERFSAGLALVAFSAVCVSGMITGASAERVLFKAVLSIVIFFVIGAACGAITKALIKENVRGKERAILQEESFPESPCRENEEELK